jgi:hypothetical protein
LVLGYPSNEPLSEAHRAVIKLKDVPGIVGAYSR